MFEVPVVFMIYNRPALTRQVFEVIRQVQPQELYIIADGPKNKEDAVLCNKARQIIQKIDWKCNVYTHFSDYNIGVAKCPADGLHWVFNQVEQAVILEDDTLPHPSFFNYCKALLDYYKHDESIMCIGGTNLCGSVDVEVSYGFSRFSLPPWGWASWRRAWKLYDFEMKNWMSNKNSLLHFVNNFPFWETFLDRYSQKLSSWDVQWNYTLWQEKGWAIIPKNNLIRNLGYNESATFTKVTESFILDLPLQTCSFPLIHPTSKIPNLDAAMELKVIQFMKEIMLANNEKQRQ